VPKKLRTHVFLVELFDRTTYASEVKKVRALNKGDAHLIAGRERPCYRWNIRRVVLTKGNTNKRDQAVAALLRSKCTGYL
jgi:hypothetical protein